MTISIGRRKRQRKSIFRRLNQEKNKRRGHNFKRFCDDQSNTSLKASSTITQNRQLNIDVIIQNFVHHGFSIVALKHCLYFKLLRLVARFSPVSKYLFCPMILVILINLKMCENGLYRQEKETSEKATWPTRWNSV